MTDINIDINTGADPIKFFFFGCWNDDITITEKIINNINDSSKFGLVNGDNFYPIKFTNESGHKIKNYDMNTIKKGFDILKKFLNSAFVPPDPSAIFNAIE